jgi:hypothetical protein
MKHEIVPSKGNLPHARRFVPYWTCSDSAHHEHPSYWRAWMCGKLQQYAGITVYNVDGFLFGVWIVLAVLWILRWMTK